VDAQSQPRTGARPAAARSELRATLDSLGPLLGRAGELLVVIAAVALLLALFLPWYELPFALERLDAGRVERDRPSGWESFESADVVLAVMAAAGLASAIASRVLGSRVPHVVAAHAGWFAVVVVLYSYYRPAIAETLAYPGPPAGGFFLALWAAGAMTGGSLTALFAARADEPAAASPPPTTA
jgi:hypothetical protein